MNYRGNRPEIVAVYRSENGIKVKVRKNKPAKCSTPKRVCIKCRANIISKNDSNYNSKVCKQCTEVL